MSEGGQATVADRRLHPATLVGRTLRVIPEAAGGMAAYGALIAKADAARVVGFVALGLLAAAAIAFLTWWRFRYGVGEREIVIESGVLRRQRRVIPFERVQDIGIERRLLARLFGTANVRIETGGSSADEGHLDSIALADAHALRDHIRGRQGSAGPAEATAEAPAEPLLFAMGLGRVVYSGLFNFSLVFVVALFAVGQNFSQAGLWDPYDLSPAMAKQMSSAWVAAALALGFAVVLLGFVAGIVRTVARDYGFRLTRAQTGLRRTRGLTTLSETVIPMRRMQVAQIGSGLITRALGWHRLDFQTLGGAEGKRERGAQVAAPFARLEEIRPILAEARFPDLDTAGEWRRAPARAILRRVIAPLVAAAITTTAAFALAPEAGFAAAFFLLVALTAPLRWRRHLWAVGEEALFIRGGVMRRRARIMPFGRAQAIEVTRGPLQRALGLASLRVDTAGAPAAGGMVAIDLEAEDAQALAETLLALFSDRRRIEHASRNAS